MKNPFGLRLSLLISAFCLLASGPVWAGIFDEDWAPPFWQAPARGTVTPPPAVAASIAASSGRQAVPDKTSQARARRFAREVFAKQLADESATGRRALAKRLLKETTTVWDVPADQFVLFLGAIDASREAGDLRLAFGAVDAMSRFFDIDEVRLKVDIAAKMAPVAGHVPVNKLKVKTDAAAGVNALAEPDAADTVHAGLELVDSLAAADEFSDASLVMNALRPLSAGDADLRAVVTNRANWLESARAGLEKIKPSLERLKASPNDPAANLAVGQYHCLHLGQWDKGLAFLCKCSDPGLRDLALEDGAARRDPARALQVANAWWDRTEANGVPEADANAIKVYAATLYRTGKEAATGLTQKVVEVRLKQAAALVSQGYASTGIETTRGPAVFVNTFGMRFVRIDPGTFVMGSPLSEPDRNENETPHEVTLTRAFYMATTIVTHGQWKAVMDGDRSRLETDLSVMESSSWQRGMQFCKKLSGIEGREYRLPTEAEWEYACRAGSTTAYGPDNLDDVAWYNANSGNKGHPVGQKKPNAWGLFDMRGNLWQWCSDCYGDYPAGPAVDPAGPPPTDEKSRHVQRGGSWYEGAANCRAARRQGERPDYGDDRMGFRVCVELGR
jgi:formylglycine-generating enzyme required for sulfatase activity